MLVEDEKEGKEMILVDADHIRIILGTHSEEIGDPAWGIFINRDGYMTCRHVSEPSWGWKEIINLKDFPPLDKAESWKAIDRFIKNYFFLHEKEIIHAVENLILESYSVKFV